MFSMSMALAAEVLELAGNTAVTTRRLASIRVFSTGCRNDEELNKVCAYNFAKKKEIYVVSFSQLLSGVTIAQGGVPSKHPCHSSAEENP
jgi:hypothetical protein